MNKHTANSMQFIGRVGNSSTKPSARGVNLLGWEGDEGPLSPEQQRDVLLRKVYGLAAQRKTCTDAEERKRMGAEITALNLKIHALKGARKEGGPVLDVYLLDVIKEHTPRLTWERWVKEARERMDALREPAP